MQEGSARASVGDEVARDAEGHDAGDDLVGRGLLAVMVAVGVLCTAALVVLPSDVPSWSPWVLGGVVALMVALRGRYVTLGLGTDAQVGISPTTAVLFVGVLLVPAPLLPLVVLLHQEPTGKGLRRDTVNFSLDLLTAASVVAVVGLVTGPLKESGTPAALTSAMVALLAAATWWLVSTLAVSWVIWQALGVPLSLSPVVQPAAARILAGMLVIGATSVVLLESSPWNVVVVAMLVWLLVRQSSDQRAMRSAGNDRRTGMPRYEVFLEGAELELARSVRTGGAVSVLMVDLDHFKRVNHDHGHSAANHVLTEIAARIRAGLRVTDVAGRYGGEEFCVLLPDTAAEQAVVVAERIRADVARRPAKAGEAAVAVTASVGVAQMLTGESVPEALDRADQALSAAKERGRDRVVLAVDLRAR